MKDMGEALEVRVIGLFLAGNDDMRVGTIREDRFAELALNRDEVEIRIPKALQTHELAERPIVGRKNRLDVGVFHGPRQGEHQVGIPKMANIAFGSALPDPLPLLPENRGNEGRAVK